MKKYGIGVLGCGAVWEYHRAAFAKSNRLRCVSVFDPARQRAIDAGKLTGAKVADTAEALLNDPEVDIVAVLTPVFTHVDLVEKGAAAGKHFMLEKPLSTTLADGQRIVDAIDRAGVKCFHPTLRALSSDLFEQIRQWTLPGGPLGPIRAGFYNLIGSPYAPSAWLMDRKYCFPPAEYDPHVFDTFLALTGDSPESVTCHTGNYSRKADQDDVTSMQITFKGKRYLQFDVHWIMDPLWKCPSRVTFDLACDRGMIKHNWFSAEWFTSTDQGSYASPRAKTGGDRWDHYHALIDAIENNTPIHPDHHDGLNYVRIQDAAIRSSKLRQTVMV
jgi:predicted dehydrogenase